MTMTGTVCINMPNIEVLLIGIKAKVDENDACKGRAKCMLQIFDTTIKNIEKGSL